MKNANYKIITGLYGIDIEYQFLDYAQNKVCESIVLYESDSHDQFIPKGTSSWHLPLGKHCNLSQIENEKWKAFCVRDSKKLYILKQREIRVRKKIKQFKKLLLSTLNPNAVQEILSHFKI